jgi:hypothetical protein
MDTAKIKQHKEPAGRNEPYTLRQKQLQLSGLGRRSIPDFENLSTCAMYLAP